jgi:hypothetical protein
MTGTGWVYYTIWFYVVLLIVGSVTSIFPELFGIKNKTVFDGFATYGYHRTQGDGSH